MPIVTGLGNIVLSNGLAASTGLGTSRRMGTCLKGAEGEPGGTGLRARDAGGSAGKWPNGMANELAELQR